VNNVTDFIYSPIPAKIKDYFAKIQEVKVPDKVSQEYLRSIGFKSSNDYYLIGILKELGFIDGSGKPTSRWNEYRAKGESKKVMAKALKLHYKPLFETYEDAFRKDKEALRDFFSSQTELGEKTIDLMVRTFQGLCNLADFEAPVVSGAEVVSAVPVPIPSLPSRSLAPPSININIELHLPATSDATVYEALFKAMKEHLFSQK
jgi:hypothetical protein